MKFGQLAAESGFRLELKVQQSANGYYLGTSDQEGPVSRESVEYFLTQESAAKALESGAWTQRERP